jgi:tetratricopeptide (TPR) repeat protein
VADDPHISAAAFRRFIDGRVSPAELRMIVRHLLSGCQSCQELSARVSAESGFWRPRKPRSAGETEDYQRVLGAAFRFATGAARRMAVQQLRGWGQWRMLEDLPPEERLPFVMRQRLFQHWGLFRALLAAAERSSFREPEAAAAIAELALELANLLDVAEVGGEDSAADHRARACALVGHARCLAWDLAGARQALNEAWRISEEEGSGHPVERAEILGYDAAYARLIGAFEEAETMLGQALRIYRAHSDAHLQGRTLVKMASAIGDVDPDKGLRHVQEGIELLNAAREPRIELCAQHTLASLLTEAGRPQEALAVLDRARALYEQFPDSWTQIRLDWIQGKIARALDELPAAAAILRQVCEDFEARVMKFDLVLAAIDLAETLVASGEVGGAAGWVARTQPVLSEWRLARHLLAAWLVLRKALEEDDGDPLRLQRLLARLALYYRRHWHRPAEFTAEDEPETPA